MTLVINQESNEAQIRELIDAWANAFRAKNIDGLMANHRRISCCSTFPRRFNIAARTRTGRIGSSGFDARRPDRL